MAQAMSEVRQFRDGSVIFVPHSFYVTAFNDTVYIVIHKR